MASVLVVEDNNMMREMLTEMLKRAGYDVIEAANGEEGCDLYREKLPDLMITDILMPEKNGAEAIFELFKEFPEIKIIVISGGGALAAEDYFKSIKALTNIKHTFSKPFNMSDLLQAVKELIG